MKFVGMHVFQSLIFASSSLVYLHVHRIIFSYNNDDSNLINFSLRLRIFFDMIIEVTLFAMMNLMEHHYRERSCMIEGVCAYVDMYVCVKEKANV